MKWMPKIATVVFALICTSALAWWLEAPSQFTIQPKVPIEESELKKKPINPEGKFVEGTGKPSASTTMWPHFRGKNFDLIDPQNVSLMDSWPEGGPKKLWEVDLGQGYAAAAVANGCVYVMDYDEKSLANALRCLSLETGEEIWRRTYRVIMKSYHGISRTIPATDGKYVVAIGPNCSVICVDAKTGDYKWGIDMQVEFGTDRPEWYAGQCPFIEDGKVLIAPVGRGKKDDEGNIVPGSDILMMAVDCETGEKAWQVMNKDGWKMSHSSITPMTLLGVEQYVYFAEGGAIGVSKDGKVLWTDESWAFRVVAPSPVQVGDDKILITSGYGAGSMALRFTKEGNTFKVSKGKRWTKKEFACEQQTPILYKDHLFTVLPKDAGATKEQMVCMDVNWNIKWMSGKDSDFGIGPFLIADDKIFVLNDDGVLTMAKFSTTGFEQLAQADVLPNHDAWGPIAIVDGKMLVRDLYKMVCLDLREK